MTTNFTQLGIEQSLQDRLSAINITEPTAVQEKVIPLISEGQHLLFQSETGTGKTFAYLLPLIQKFSNKENKDRHINFLIVSPTLELASQIRNQIKMISDLKCTLLIGGAPLSRQIEALKEKPAIVIGGSARILELIHLKKLKTDGIEALVLDEADRLLSPELRDATEGLIERLPKNIQLIGNSATVSSYTKKILLKSREKDDIQLVELPAEDILRKRITHWAIYAERRDKIDTLRAFINAEKPEKLIVFTSKSDQINNIVSKLQWKKINCAGLSAKVDKKSRKSAFDQFKSGKVSVLVTTDLASRGLDIQGITHVVQMDLPESEDFFIHRAGRTGRAGKTGINCVIGDEREMNRYAALEKKLKLTVYPKVLYGGKITAPE
ncbi:MAG: DEAD/DEAH box helicase [Treponema sp.]|nr:DEAD/DEAH box helicase [Treponema sp.]